MTLASVARYDRTQLSALGERAVVVGGSMAGLAAARVLADAFGEVVVLERDEFPDGPARRDGAPQTGHPHVMLEAGRATLEDFFPGFGESVLSAGGLLLDAGSEATWYDQGGCLADTAERLPMYCATRPLFEHVVRERVRAGGNVRLRDGCQFLDYDLDGNRVTGVRFRDERGEETGLGAALVVDATGRTSRTPRWLDEHGYPAPDVDEVEVGVTYSTVRIDRPADDRRATFLAPERGRPRGAGLVPVEGGQWEVILQGVNGEDAPTDRDQFEAWADGVPLNEFGRLVRGREWTSGGIHQYPFPSSVRRHYESLDRFPEGLVVTGDAIASFNPIYGQGMSVAALDALVLHHELAGGLEGLAPRAFDRASGIVDEAWKLAVGNDFIFPGTTGPKPVGTDLFNAYVARLVRRAHNDGALAEAFLRVFRLEQSVTSLLRPGVAWRVFRPRLGRADAGSAGDLDVPTDGSASEPPAD
jgi:2-polyprenyl-6-methoxyphenol hydroxylase-like FAD-dependent oxidoreductase